MVQIVLEGSDPHPLAQMMAALLQANTAADAAKERIVEFTRAAVQLDVTDAQVTVGLKFTPGAVVVTSGPVPGADLRISADSETMLGLSSMPMRFGLPDLSTSQGRDIAKKLATRTLRIKGILAPPPRGAALLRKVSRLLSTG